LHGGEQEADKDGDDGDDDQKLDECKSRTMTAIHE
jgi:hypothetical protein